MNEYKQAQLEPFKPHQCMHWNSDGIRCRAYARHNDYTCFQHRIPDEPSIPIVANDPFTLPSLRTRDGICEALDAIAAHLAGKTIDDRRANLLLYTIQLASQQHPRPIPAQPGAPRSGAPGSTAPSTLGIQEDPSTPEYLGEEQTTATESEAEPEDREYTKEERGYLGLVYDLGCAPITPRPASLTAEEVDAFAARSRALLWNLNKEYAALSQPQPDPETEPAPQRTTVNKPRATQNEQQTSPSSPRSTPQPPPSNLEP